jgi:hypothetical protein
MFGVPGSEIRGSAIHDITEALFEAGNSRVSFTNQCKLVEDFVADEGAHGVPLTLF